jgi:hypothetical protein
MFKCKTWIGHWYFSQLVQQLNDLWQFWPTSIDGASAENPNGWNPRFLFSDMCKYFCLFGHKSARVCIFNSRTFQDRLLQLDKCSWIIKIMFLLFKHVFRFKFVSQFVIEVDDNPDRYQWSTDPCAWLLYRKATSVDTELSFNTKWVSVGTMNYHKQKKKLKGLLIHTR